MSKKNVTFSDIAEYTHFSKTTISRYFNNPDSLTLENQQIIVCKSLLGSIPNPLTIFSKSAALLRS